MTFQLSFTGRLFYPNLAPERDHSKNDVNAKMPNFRPHPPMSELVTFFIITSPLNVTRQIVTNFFLLKTLKNNFTYFVQLTCNWHELNRSNNEPTTYS